VSIGLGLGLSLGARGAGAAAFDPLTAVAWKQLYYPDATLAGLADGTAIASFADLSGNGFTLTQATGSKQPAVGTVNGRKAVVWDGGDALASAAVDYSGTTAASFFWVGNQTADGAVVILYELSANAGSTAKAFGVYREASNLQDCQMACDSAGASHLELPLSTATLQSTDKILDIRFNQAVRRQKVAQYHNGLWQVASHSQVTTDIGTGLANAATFLGARNQASNFQTGHTLFCGVAASRLSPLVRKQMLDWLSTTFGIAITSPAGPVVFDGDSNTDGVQGTSNKLVYSDLLGKRFSNAYDIFNHGKSGDKISDVIARYPTQTRPLSSPSMPKNVYHINAGINDFFNGGSATHVAVDTVWGRLQSLCTLAKADGFTVVVNTLLPNNNAGWNAANQDAYEATDRPDINNRITTQLVSGGYADAVVDVATDTHIGSTTAYTDATYWDVDQAHLNATGHISLADLMEPVLDGLGVT
jgi:lysophospholipase L1-like esterase